MNGLAKTPDILRIMGTTQTMPLEERGMTDNVHVVGGAERLLDIASRPAIFELINQAIQAHGITGVLLHGPWRLPDPRHVNSDVTAKTRHDHFMRCLRVARDVISARYPSLTVKSYLDEVELAGTDWSVPLEARHIEIHCMDPRLDDQLVEAFERAYILRIPGGASSFNSPAFAELMLSQLARIYEKLRKQDMVIESITLCDHWDCAGLGGTEMTREMEVAKHQRHLLDAATIMRRRFELLGYEQPKLTGRIYRFSQSPLRLNLE